MAGPQLKPSIETEKQLGCLYRTHPVVTRDMTAAGSMVIALEAARRAANPKSRRDTWLLYTSDAADEVY